MCGIGMIFQSNVAFCILIYLLKKLGSVYLVWHESFCERNGSLFTLIFCKTKDLCLHNNDFLCVA